MKEIEEKLRAIGSNHAGVICLKNGTRVNYGSIRVENGYFIHYTGQGLKEIWSQPESEKSQELQKLDEEALISLQHIARTSVSEIEEIIS